MAVQRLSKGLLSQGRLAYQYTPSTQYLVLSQQSLIHTSTDLRRALTEGTPTRESPLSSFQKLRQGMSNLITGSRSSERKGDDNVDRNKSPEAHPFPDERAGSVYVQAQWQDGGVIHDVKPHGQGISLSNREHARGQAEKDLASA